MSTLRIICGFLGAGKTTFSKKLVDEFGALHLNPDEWCVNLFSKEEYEQNWDSCFDKTVDFLWKKAIENLENGVDVVFDMGFWSKASRDFAKHQATKLGCDSKLYYVFAPDEVLKERILQRSGKIAESNILRFDDLKRLFDEPSKEEDFIKIDNF